MTDLEKSNGKVLIVDDNPSVLSVLKSLLSSENYQVETSTNGQEAMEVLNDKPVDIIISDIMMPEMDGYMLQNILRQSPEYAHIPFVFLTALGNEEEIRKGQESGADDYLVKPFDAKELLSVVKGKIRRSQKIKSQSVMQYERFKSGVIKQISHEFKTPLVSVTTGSEFLLEENENLDEQQKAGLLKSIYEGGQRLHKLVSDFITVQQLQNGHYEKAYKKQVAEHVVAEIVSDFVKKKAHELEPEGFSIKLIDHSNAAKARICKNHLLEILNRFICNAVKFSKEEKEITIHLKASSDKVIISVIDFGIGLDPKQLEEITDIFNQQNREVLEQQGPGLGLAIAKEIAEINEAQISFENNDTLVGAKFCLTLKRMP